MGKGARGLEEDEKEDGDEDGDLEEDEDGDGDEEHAEEGEDEDGDEEEDGDEYDDVEEDELKEGGGYLRRRPCERGEQRRGEAERDLKEEESMLKGRCWGKEMRRRREQR